MNPTTFPIILIGNMLLLVLVQGLLPKFIVNGPDKRQLRDDPKLKRYLHGITAAALLLLIGLFSLNLPPIPFDLSVFGLLIALGFAVMIAEKKYLPNTRRHLVTLCWIGGIVVIAGLYMGVTY